MKKIVTAIVALVFLLNLASPSMASANGLLSVKSNTATVKIEKAPKQSKPTKVELILNSKTLYVNDNIHDNNILVKVTYKDKTINYVPVEDVKLTLSNSKIVKIVEKRYLSPLKAGKATITGTYKGVKGKVAVTVKSATNGQFSVEIPNLDEASYVETQFYYRKKHGTKKNEYHYNYLNVASEKTSKGFKFSKINWNKYPTIYGTIKIENKLFYLEVNKKDNKKTIKLNPKNLTEVSFKYPNKGTKTNEISITKVDSNKVKLGLSSFYSDKIFLPKQTLNIQLKAGDSKSGYYNVSLRNQKIKGTKQTITISSKDIAALTIKTVSSGKNTLSLDSLSLYDHNQAGGSYYNPYDQKVKSLKVNSSKITYDMNARVLANDKWYYEFSAPTKISKNKTMNIGDKLTASISFKKGAKFYTGKSVYLSADSKGYYGSFNVKDQYGNPLSYISGYSSLDRAQGVLVFKSSKKTYRIPVTSFQHSSFTLPATAGTYKVKFEMEVKK